MFAIFVDLDEVGNQITQVDYRFLVAAWVAFAAGLSFYALRWRVLLANKPGFLRTFDACNVGHMLNILLPLRAGEPVRIVMIARSPNVTIPESVSSIVIEKQIENLMRIGAFVGALFLGLGLEFSPLTGLASLLLMILVVAGLILMLRYREQILESWPKSLARIPRMSEEKIRQILKDFFDGLSALQNIRLLGFAFLWSLMIWGSFFVFQFLTLIALDTELSLFEQISISLAVLALAPPSAPTQPGIYHASVVAPLGAIGLETTGLTAYAVVLHIQEMVLMTAFGIVGVIHSKALQDLLRIIKPGSVEQSVSEAQKNTGG